ncbi:hypothetical protein As57867_005677, partial [Aphanomyces stellatus]
MANTSTCDPVRAYIGLEMLEPLWTSFTSDASTFNVAFGGTLGVIMVAAVTSSLACGIMDLQPSLRKYKIQSSSLPTLARYVDCLKHIAINQMVVHVPLILAVVALWGDRSTFAATLPLPTLSTIALEFILFMLCEDFLFYWMHRLLHWKLIYKYVHK